jgi:hypothetical protein
MTAVLPTRTPLQKTAEASRLALFVAPYLLVLWFFASVDVYHRHFFEPRFSLPYNAARIVFAAYLFWIVYFSGAAILERFFKAFLTIPLMQRLPLGFFFGAAVWTLAMLALGYLSLYIWPVAATLTVAIVLVSYRHFYELGGLFTNRVRDLGSRDIPLIGMALIVLAAAALLLMVKGLYPAGGHDYFTHYFYYYNAVIDRHDIWPNEVWYHYYYSKAMGLFFLGMLLTDPLAPSLVTFCFAAAAALALFALVDRFNPGTLWPWVAVTLYLALYITTRSTGIYLSNGGWGDFQKPHEINAAFMIAILWTSIGLLSATEATRKIWWVAGALCAFVLAFVTTVSSLLVGLFCCLMTVGCFLVRSRRNALAFFGLSIMAGAGLLSVLILNYLTTGLPLDNGIEIFWPILDIQRLRQWGVIPELLALATGRSSMFQNRLPLVSPDMKSFLLNVFRTESLNFLLRATVALGSVWLLIRVAVWAAKRSGRPRLGTPHVAALATLVTFIVSLLAIGLVTGSTQPISFVRYSSFVLPLMIATAAGLWQLMGASLPSKRGLRILTGCVIPVLLLVGTLSGAYRSYGPFFVSAVGNAARFVTGRYSIYDSYVDQAGWPGRSPEGAIRPWAHAVWKELGPGTRFWVFDVHTYCMLPDCRPETFMSFRMSPRSMDVMLGNASQARQILQQEGLDYFLIAMDDQVVDALPCTELFSPDHIAEHLGVKWRDQTHVLLTWLGPGIEPLTAAWIEEYRKHVQTAACGYVALLKNAAPQLANNPRWGAGLAKP